ncbi:ATP synthase subunit G atp20 [Rhizina undulata]
MRPVLRSARLGARMMSTASQQTGAQTASKAQETAKIAVKKAGEVLAGLGNSLGKVGGRTGRVIRKVEVLIPPTIYYSKVALELSKLVFKGQKMAPPDLATFQSTFTPLLTALKSPVESLSYLSTFVRSLRTVTKAQLATAGVLGAEVLGFFTIGEIIGRRKLIGYRGDTAAHH